MDIEIGTYKKIGYSKPSFVVVKLDGEDSLSFEYEDLAWDIILHWVSWMNGSDL